MTKAQNKRRSANSYRPIAKHGALATNATSALVLGIWSLGLDWDLAPWSLVITL
jgi:hypothetical protein